ncbi:MAG: ABC transporter ATP-binding protein [Chloroflexi bacterium]|nr:MAG: ABC transporter ATP-binding protein [Chloroflexota bacterium]
MISLQNVSKTYILNKKMVVEAAKNCSLEVSKGEFVVITGRSGSGKTTLLNLVAGLTFPTSGKVLIDDIEVWNLPDKELSKLRNEKIGFVFQFPSLIPSLTSLENVILPTIYGSKFSKEEAHKRALQLLDEVGLSDKIGSLPRQLSAGQQQRVVIARSLINSPDLLLADEPTSDLDEQTEHEVMTLFQNIHQRTGITIMLVTHASELVTYGSRSVRMTGGEITEDRKLFTGEFIPA